MSFLLAAQGVRKVSDGRRKGVGWASEGMVVPSEIFFIHTPKHVKYYRAEGWVDPTLAGRRTPMMLHILHSLDRYA